MYKNKKHNQKNAGFTLIEVLVSVVLSGMILTSAYAGFQGILKSQVRLSGVISIQRNLFYLNEKLSTLIHGGGTLDYEEYFNRRVLGYTKSFGTDGTWTYTSLSRYGNGDNVSGRPVLYLCGIAGGVVDENACLGSNAASIAPNTTLRNITLSAKQMAYGQYREIGFNYASLSGYPTPIKLPPIFPPAPSDNGINKEGLSDLYLIKKLPSGVYERTYFRHVYVQDPSITPDIKTCDPATGIEGCLGKIQMTRLTSCDSLPAGGDGVMDAWAPHSDFGGGINPCSIIDIVGKISAATNALVWVDISSPDMNITRAQFLPRPLKIPGRMAGVGEAAISPTIQIHLEVQLSQRVLTRGLLKKEENPPRFLTTTFDLDNT